MKETIMFEDMVWGEWLKMPYISEMSIFKKYAGKELNFSQFRVIRYEEELQKDSSK